MKKKFANPPILFIKGYLINLIASCKKKILQEFLYLSYVQLLAKVLGKIYLQVITYLDQALNHWLCDDVCLGGSSLAGQASMAPYWAVCVCGPFCIAAGLTHKSHYIPNPLLF